MRKEKRKKSLFVGLLVCWFVGLLVCWFVGLFVCLWRGCVGEVLLDYSLFF